MLKFFKSAKRLDPVEEALIVEQIHKEFNTASDNALAEANAILGNIKSDKIEKANRLAKLGFKSTEAVKEGEFEQLTKAAMEKSAKVIVNYKEKYPLYKFISEEDVVKICKKYNLICGPVSRFIGDVPEKNIAEMENFRVKSEDIPYQITVKAVDFYHSTPDSTKNRVKAFLSKNPTHILSAEEVSGYGRDTIISIILSKHGVTDNARLYDCTAKVEECTGFLICGPTKDFNMEGSNTEGTFIKETVNVKFSTQPVPDPVVLQRVKHGFLIVTAWGPEASDLLVVNEINN